MDVLKVLHPKLMSNQMSLPSVLVALALWQSKSFGQFARINLVAQLAVFIPCVQIPAFQTGRLTYVDLAWPTGLFVMGFHSFVQSLYRSIAGANEDTVEKPKTTSFTAGLRKFLIAFAYMFQGGRMAFGAWTMFSVGHMRKEMQRYTFQRQRWAAVGITAAATPVAEIVEIQKEAFTQCLANLGIQAVPIALQSQTNAGPMNLIELFGWCVWCSSFVIEHMSDLQKMAFGQAMKKQGLRGKVCNVGLWNHTRHPNYFGEWMVWVALAITSLPSLKKYLDDQASDSKKNKDDPSTRRLLTAGLLLVPVTMYICLVHWTGAVPAEFYSLKNRPDYAQYMREVNCFFPGPRHVGA